jgi:8-amino-7-oxononanoate synthase
MTETLSGRLRDELNHRQAAGLQRQLSLERLIDFTSNDYLGLARSQDLWDMITERSRILPEHRNGATGSRLLSGNSALAEEVEQQLAQIFQSETALLFNSGYAANLGVLSSIPTRSDTILYDELSHASIKDGARLSLARKLSFRHNNLDDLEAKLRRTEGHSFIVVESIYSMDGDRCPLAELTRLAKAYDATLILDEAHSTGIDGTHGEGMAVAMGLAGDVGIRIYTFGKAMGGHGACVAGPSVLKDYLVNTSRPFIYTTALPPHALLTLSCAFEYLAKRPHLAEQLRKNVTLFSDALSHHPAYTNSHTAIQRVTFGGNENVNAAALYLRAKGFDVRAIRKPTVPEGSERIRICLHAFNTAEEIAALAEAINKLNIAP